MDGGGQVEDYTVEEAIEKPLEPTEAWVRKLVQRHHKAAMKRIIQEQNS